MGFFECCSAFIGSLPNPALPLLPSLLLGTSFASLILLYLYKKETNLPLCDILIHTARNLFWAMPDGPPCHAGPSERCSSIECVRCEKHEVLRQQIKNRWKTWRRKVDLEPLRRVEEAVARLEEVKEGEARGEMESRKEGRDEVENSQEDKKEMEGGNRRDGKVKKRQGETETEGNIKHRGRGKGGDAEGPGRNRHEEEVASEKPDPQKSLQKPTIFSMDLPANPDWTEYEVHVNDQKLLKLNFDLIQKEFVTVFEELQAGNTAGWKNNTITQGHWCIFPLVNQGKIIAANCRRCPGVAELVLGCLPGVMNDCVFGNAAFSILYPNSHITPHTGPSNLRLRCHLGLKVPPGCWLEVAGQQHRWGVTETLLFDDSFTHSAHFGSRPSDAQAQPRAVLLLDFWHPDLTEEEKVCLVDLLAPLD